MAGPISETLSTMNGLPGRDCRRRFTIGSATIFSSSLPRARSLTMRMFSPETSCKVASPCPAFARRDRISSMENGFWNFSWIDVPPARSIPRFAFPR
jgi:hypothetical protein